MPTDADFDGAIAYAEERLRELEPRPDVPLQDLAVPEVLNLGIVRQGFLLYQSVLRLCSVGGMAAALIVFRAVVEATIVVRWLELNPDLHVSMYVAEDDRHRLNVGTTAVPEMRRRRGLKGPPLFGHAEVLETRASIRLVRADAVKAGEHIDEQRGSLLPTLERMADDVNDTAIWEAYQLLYRITSPWAHSSGRALTGQRLVERPTGVHLTMGVEWTPRLVRAIAATTVAVLFAAGSRAAGAEIEGECRVIQNGLAEWPIG